MREIKIVAGPHDGQKVLERVAAFRQPGYVRRQVPGVDAQRADATDTLSRKRAKLRAAAQVRLSIDHLRLPKVRVVAWGPFAAKVRAVVAAVAITLRVHDVTALSPPGVVQSRQS